jgi:flagellar protein FlaG
MDVNAVNPSAHALSAPAQAIPVDRAAENREVVQAVKALNGTEMFGQGNELTFQMDAQTKRMVIRVVNRQTKEVLSQVPPEYVLRLAEDLKSQPAP